MHLRTSGGKHGGCLHDLEYRSRRVIDLASPQSGGWSTPGVAGPGLTSFIKRKAPWCVQCSASPVRDELHPAMAVRPEA